MGERPEPPKPSLPYDAEVEWLESTGAEYIDTGVVGSDTSVVALDVQLLELNPSKAVFGCYGDNASLYLYQTGMVLPTAWQVGFGGFENVGTVWRGP